MSYIETMKNEDNRYDVKVDSEELHCGYKTEPEAYAFGQKIAENNANGTR